MAVKPITEEDLKTKIFKFGGYDPRDQEEFDIPENAIIDGQNMALEIPVGADAKSALTVRKGYTKKNSVNFSNSKTQGGYIYKRSNDLEDDDGTVLVSKDLYYSVVIAEGKMFVASVANISDDFSYSEIDTDNISFEYTGMNYFSTTNRIEMIQYQNYLFIVDGENKMRYWDGDILREQDISDDARPSIIVLHKNRLFVNNTLAGYQNNIYCSSISDPLDWNLPTDDPIGDAAIQPFSGYPDEKSAITAIGAYSNSLLVQQQNRAFLWETIGSPYNADGVITWNIRELSVDDGAIAQAPQADLGEKIMYLATKGVQEMYGIQALQGNSTFTLDNINAKPVSYDIEPKLFSLNWDDAVAVYFNFYYILCLKTQGSINNNIALVYDTRRGVWYVPWTNYNFSWFHKADINGIEYCFAGDATCGCVYTLFTSNKDSGTDIEAYFDMRLDNMGAEDRSKTFRKCSFWFRNESVNGIYFSYKMDYGPRDYCPVEWKSQGAGAAPLGSFLLGGTRLGEGFTGKNVRHFRFNGRRGRNITLRWSNNNEDNTGNKGRFTFYGYVLKGYIEDEDNRDYME